MTLVPIATTPEKYKGVKTNIHPYFIVDRSKSRWIYNENTEKEELHNGVNHKFILNLS